MHLMDEKGRPCCGGNDGFVTHATEVRRDVDCPVCLDPLQRKTPPSRPTPMDRLKDEVLVLRDRTAKAETAAASAEAERDALHSRLRSLASELRDISSGPHPGPMNAEDYLPLIRACELKGLTDTQREQIGQARDLQRRDRICLLWALVLISEGEATELLGMDRVSARIELEEFEKRRPRLAEWAEAQASALEVIRHG